jgi:cytochrome P450
MQHISSNAKNPHSPTASPFELFERAFLDNPYPTYSYYRREAPNIHNGGGDNGGWHVFRHADCSALLHHPKMIVEPVHGQPEPSGPYAAFQGELQRQMLFRDPPHHTRLRGLVNKAFTPRAIHSLEPRIRGITAGLLAAHSGAGAFDFMQEFAVPFPLLVIADLLGVPAQDRNALKRWSHAMVAGIDRRRSQDTDSILTNAEQATIEFAAYLRELIVLRRRSPTDDLLSALIAAEDQHTQLSEQELVSMCILLLNAGHETTTNLLGNGLYALLQRPQQFSKLRQHPELSISAADELLRFDPPVQMTSRTVAGDFQFQGIQFLQGETVHLVLGSANHDESVFVQPEHLDIARADRRYLSFSHGIHFCLGAPLARLECAIALETIIKLMPAIRLAETHPTWNGSVIFRGLESLKIAG